MPRGPVEKPQAQIFRRVRCLRLNKPDPPMRTLLTATAAASVLAAASFLTAACGSLGGAKMVGDGPVVNDERMLTSFDEIDNSTSADVTVVRGPEQRVVVNAPSDLQPYLVTEVKGDKLTIETSGSYSTRAEYSVDVTVAELEAFTVDGSGDVTISGFDGGKLALAIDGSGDVDVRDVEYDRLTISVDGSGDTRLAGGGDELEVAIDGSGGVDAYDFPVDAAEVTVKGAGDVRVRADADLKIKIDGSGDVFYRGNPNLQLEDKGSGEARQDN